MKREEVKAQFQDIRKWFANSAARTAEWKWTKTDAQTMERIDEIERLALRATDPDMVMVPRETMQALHNHVLDAHNGAVEALNVLYDLERTRVFIPESQEDQT